MSIRFPCPAGDLQPECDQARERCVWRWIVATFPIAARPAEERMRTPSRKDAKKTPRGTGGFRVRGSGFRVQGLEFRREKHCREKCILDPEPRTLIPEPISSTQSRPCSPSAFPRPLRLGVRMSSRGRARRRARRPAAGGSFRPITPRPGPAGACGIRWRLSNIRAAGGASVR